MKTKMTMLELLKGALGLIKDIKGWTQEQNAARAGNQRAYVQDEDAKRFCAGGALLRISGATSGQYDAPPAVKRALKALKVANGGVNIIDSNDGHDAGKKKMPKAECHKRVVAAYRKAIRTETAKVKAKAA